MSGGDPLLVPSDQGPTIQHRGILLYPAADPRGAARERARAARLAPRTLVYVPSVGLGYGLAELLALLPESSGVLCVETSEQIMRLALAAGLPRDARLCVVRTSDPEEAARAARTLGLERFRRVVEVPLCAGYRLDPAVYAGLRRALETMVRAHWQDAATLIAMGSLWVRNLFENLVLLPGSRDFSCLASEAPLVVAGAGPSLEQSIPLLREAREGFLLAAADTALPRLLEEGLRPDIVVALEAQVANLEDFLPAPGPDTMLACELSAHPDTARLFPRGRFFFSSRFAPLTLFRRLDQAGLLPCPFPALGSVGVAAVHAGLRLTRGEVFLTGLDFSYPGSRTHARGTPRHLAALRSANRVQTVEQQAIQSLAARRRILDRDKRGGTVVTDTVLRSYRDGLRTEAASEVGRLWDIGQTGLDLGVRRLDEQGFLRHIRSAGARNPRPSVHEGSAVDVGDLATFFAREIGLLDRALTRIPEMLSPGAPEARISPGAPEARISPGASEARISPAVLLGGDMAAADREVLSAVDYAFLHFPDGREPGRVTESYLARARVAALYYRQRLQRLADGISPRKS